MRTQRREQSVLDPRRSRAFTLIELLVVVTIITLLVAILVPSMRLARDATRIVVCTSNQRQIAVGALSYAADNAAHLMISKETSFYTSGRDPVLIGTDTNTTAGDWNVYRIQPYLNGFDLTTHQARGVFLCPGVDADFYAWFAQTHWQTWASTAKFTQLCYGYYAGVDRWKSGEARNDADRQICLTTPGGADRLLVSDALFPDTNGVQYFRYNHGLNGWSFSYPPVVTQYGQSLGCVYDRAPPSISGLVQAFGDGSARWKDASQIKTDQMYNPASYTDGWVNRGGSSPAYY